MKCSEEMVDAIFHRSIYVEVYKRELEIKKTKTYDGWKFKRRSDLKSYRNLQHIEHRLSDIRQCILYTDTDEICKYLDSILEMISDMKKHHKR